MKRALLTLLTLAFLTLACSMQVPNSQTPLPTATNTAVLTPTATELGTATPVWTSVVRMEYVYVRSVPNGSSVGIIRKNTEVEIVDCDNTWCEIVEPAGYVWRGCLADNPEHLGCRSK